MEESKISGYRIYGINDDHHICSCCGKRNLKKVVWLAALDETGSEFSDPEPYGVDCAARLLNIGKMSKESAEKKIASMFYREFQLWKLEQEKVTAIENDFMSVRIKVIRGGGHSDYVPYSYPADLAELVKSGSMTVEDANKEKVRRFPIFGFVGGSVADMVKFKNDYGK